MLAGGFGGATMVSAAANPGATTTASTRHAPTVARARRDCRRSTSHILARLVHRLGLEARAVVTQWGRSCRASCVARASTDDVQHCPARTATAFFDLRRFSSSIVGTWKFPSKRLIVGAITVTVLVEAALLATIRRLLSDR